MSNEEQHLSAPKVTIKHTYAWALGDVLVEWGAYRSIVRRIAVKIERDPEYASEHLTVSTYGINAKGDGTPDKRSQWGWYHYPGPEFERRYVEHAKRLWAEVIGEFREERE